MAELGEVLFWRIAMRPGPMAIGRIGGQPGSQRRAADGGEPAIPSACPATRSP